MPKSKKKAKSVTVISSKLIKCPFCQKHFTNLKNTNTHITIRHDKPFSLSLPKDNSHSLKINSIRRSR